MRGPKRITDGFELRILTFALVLSMVIISVVIVDPADAQVSPRYNDPEIAITFDQMVYNTRFENNAHIADVTVTVYCSISSNAPDGTKVRVNLVLTDEFDYRMPGSVQFQKGGRTEEEFHFQYFTTGEFQLGVGIMLTLSSDWEYLSPEEGSGDLVPITTGVEIGSYCILGVERYKPLDTVKLDRGKWMTIELNIKNLGNTEVTVFIKVDQNPSDIEVDIKRSWVIVGAFGQFPFSFTIRCYDNREIDSHLILKAKTDFRDEEVIAEHRIDVTMEKDDSRINMGSGAMLALVPSLVILFFIVMLVFWARLVWMKRRQKKEQN
jgi:hypothetical protein